MFLHPGSILSIPFSSFPSKFGPHVVSGRVLCTSPKVNNLVVFVLCPCGGLCRLFLVPLKPRTPRVFRPLVPAILFSVLLLGLLWRLSVRLILPAKIRSQKFDLKYFGLN